VQILVGGIVAVSIAAFVLVRFRRPHIYKRFPGLLTKGYQQRLMLGTEEGEAESEPIEELSALGKVLTSNKTWSSTTLLEVLLISGIAIFYLSATMIEWRIRRNMESGIARSLDVSIIGGDAILKGPVPTDDLYVEASRTAAEIVGSGHVINRLQVEQPEILGEESDEIGEAQIEIDSLYDDSLESIRQITAVVNLPQFETVTVRRGVNLPQLIASRYGINLSKLPKSYGVVANKIKQLNNPPDPTPGSLRIPILPARFKARANRMTARSRNQGQSIIGFEKNGIPFGSWLHVKVSLRPRLTLSSKVLLQIPFTRGTAVETQKSAGVELLQSSMTVRFASSGTTNSGYKSLDGDDSKAVIDALKRQARRQATVFVLDSGWPDESSYRSSIAELRKLVDTAINVYNLGKVQWVDAPYVPLPNDDKSQHCVYIRNSLSEFTDLDSRHIVKVVYVPLDTKQNAQQILHEMLRLYIIRKSMLGYTQVDEDTKNAAEKFATRTVDSIESGEPFDLEKSSSTKSDSRYRQRWRTNSAIVAAVWYLAELAAEQDAQNPVFFLNESWTVIPDTVELGAPEGVSSGILVAAAGNTLGKEVNTDTGKIDFAREATPAKNVLAVLDTKPGLNKPFCDSSQLSQDTLSITMAAAYDGEVVDGSLCGTSFSAPRIAWLLALREATRTEELQQSAWAGQLQQKLLAIRKQSSSMFEGLYLHPKDLLQ
jgi:hypothetical protein